MIKALGLTGQSDLRFQELESVATDKNVAVAIHLEQISMLKK
jgi:hypothetical protein